MNKVSRPLSFRSFAWAPLRGFGPAALLSLLALGASCKETPPGVRIDLKVEKEEFRPDYVKFNWLRPGRLTYEERLPESGAFDGSGNVLGSLFIETVGPLRDARALVVRGFRGTKEISGGLLYIHPATASRRYLELKLAAPLPDGDGSGVPDLLERNCFPNPMGTGCESPGEGGTKPDPAGDAGAGATDGGADAGAEIDATPVEADLIGWWRFDDGPNSKTAGDSSGMGNHGALRGSKLAWREGRVAGGALEIPDSADHGVTVPATASIDGIRNAFTIAAWVYRTDQRPGLANVVSRRSTGSAEHFALTITGDGLPRIYLNTHVEPAPASVTGPHPVPLDEWVHLAATYDGSIVRLFVGGAEVNEAPVTTTINASETFLCIGCGQNAEAAVTEALTGRLDDVRLYRRALGPGEIALLAH